MKQDERDVSIRISRCRRAREKKYLDTFRLAAMENSNVHLFSNVNSNATESRAGD